jgi:hypothetical protein
VYVLSSWEKIQKEGKANKNGAAIGVRAARCAWSSPAPNGSRSFARDVARPPNLAVVEPQRQQAKSIFFD